MFDLDPMSLSRLQFGMTALYHFLFVPLTLGLSFLLAIMESVYVMTGRTIWRDMTRFWGKLFGINFAMGVATGITMEFQFGTNWAYYSHYVGDIFGAPLAIEGLMAFFLESSFVGLFFFGWNRLSKLGHLTVTWLVAIGSNLSALWILIANGWMQNPVGAVFNPDTMRMELASFWELLFNPVAQAKFVHTVSAGYVTGSVFVLSVSAWYLLRGRHRAFATRSMIVASAFGLAAALSVAVLGDESGYTVSEHQKVKLAAIEAMWETEPAPAGFTLFAIPDQEKRENHAAVTVPWALGLIATRSANTVLPGIDDLVRRAEARIRNGLVAYDALERLRANRGDIEARATLAARSGDLGHALLLKRYVADPRTADDATIARAAQDVIPAVPPLFWSFRVMVALGFFFIGLFAVAFWRSCRRDFDHPLFLKICLWSLPLPWLAAEFGWVVAEYGRQPWAIDGVLPTFLASSALSAGQVLFTLAGFVLFYSSLLVVDVILMRKYIRIGPADALRPPSSATAQPIPAA
ncbi:cytochrome d terminal oxidase subunit 1 [Azospirillum thiophilum]|uniref:Cytochrome d terminal oxidase subunit 1 n=1 Tax=Azospirillum thiophilum TaxID=528244 RepID=A0AAC8ZVG8_9PROT|nr:cytochrome ubiquinol oxidase subunit I [Azospirillum thiophilum]ALG73015.1 cytochrome d terminal oxidase subunit 1 [Azospirillum thiophilum]KJR64069.1 cytochrome d terminal oxidase subunit 1 [Azospirillum thiophilum]